LELIDPVGDNQFTIIDFTGKVIMDATLGLADKRINVRELPKGVYLLAIETGTKRQNVRFIKE